MWHLGVAREKWQQVSGGIVRTSQICYLVWGMLVDSWDSTSETFFFLVFFFFFLWRTELPEEAAFDCRHFKKCSAAHLKGIRPDVQLLQKKKKDAILDVNSDHDQSGAPLAIGSLSSSWDLKLCWLSFWSSEKLQNKLKQYCCCY